jgi:hypothetical protein
MENSVVSFELNARWALGAECTLGAGGAKHSCMIQQRKNVPLSLQQQRAARHTSVVST